MLFKLSILSVVLSVVAVHSLSIYLHVWVSILQVMRVLIDEVHLASLSCGGRSWMFGHHQAGKTFSNHFFLT